MTETQLELALEPSAEEILIDIFHKWGWEAQSVTNPARRASGEYVRFKSPNWRFSYTTKVGFTHADGRVQLVRSTLEKTTADRMFYIDKTTKWIYWGGTDEFLALIGSKQQWKVSPRGDIAFIKKRKY